MVVLHLTQAICNKSQPQEKRYDVRDTRIKGLFLRVETSGSKTWYINYRTPAPEKRLKNKKLCPGSIPLAKARKIAIRFLSALYFEKRDPALEPDEPSGRLCRITLAALIDLYEPWVLKNRKSGAVTLRILRLFKEFLQFPIDRITAEEIKKWQHQKKDFQKNATINRQIAALHSLLQWALEEGFYSGEIFSFHKLPETDSKLVTRYLDARERDALIRALAKREEKHGRDYLRPAVIVSLHTGVRKGTLLSLQWEDVCFDRQFLSLRAEIMKGGKHCTVPLNQTAADCLGDWQAYSNQTQGYIFSKGGEKIKDTKRAFARVLTDAGIKDFTWHCLRHDFASQLAIKGVAMHMIQRLMCHSSISMTQRYAHLSPESLRSAAALLDT